MSAIPYSLLHNLEEKFGSVKNVPESNLTLKKIRKIIGIRPHDESKQAIYQNDIKFLLDQGYTPREISDKLMASATTVYTVMRKNHYKIMPRFKYKLIDNKANISIFANNQSSLFKIVNHSFCSLDEYKNYIANEGYRLVEKDSMFLWKDVKTGDQFYLQGKLQMKLD